MMVFRSKIRTAEYWEGYASAHQQNPKCPYSELGDRSQWAAGFAARVAECKSAKVWYKSRTLWAMAFLGLIGACLIIYGQQSGSGVVLGVGGGLSLSSIASSAMRLITDKPISQFSNPLDT
jgi:ribosome modulation factor